VDELMTVEMTGTAQGKQHAFDFVGLDGVVREPSHVLRKQIGLGLNEGDVMPCRKPTDIGCGGVLGHCFRAFGHGSSSPMKYNIPSLKIH
jgi:hypothetical protein